MCVLLTPSVWWLQPGAMLRRNRSRSKTAAGVSQSGADVISSSSSSSSLIITKKHQSLSSLTRMVLPPTNCELWSDIPGSLTVLEADKEAPLFGDPGVWPFRHKTYQLYILCYIASCYQHDNPETFLALYTRAMQPPSPAWRSNCNASLYSILTAARNKARKLNRFAPLTSLVSQKLE